MTTSARSIVREAARNNAEWCAVMSRAHGVASEFEEQAWVAAARTPLYYPDAVTLVPGTDATALADRIDTHEPGASVKDSFADLDLTGAGFQVLFEAQWIHRSAGTPSGGTDLGWEVVTDPAALRAWALAWDGGQGHADLFRPELLDDPGTFVVAGRDADRLVAGAVASRSDRVVGVSNLFVVDAGADAGWIVVLNAVRSLFPDLPVVGYQRGEGLTTALRHGFETVGPLRVWTHSGQD